MGMDRGEKMEFCTSGVTERGRAGLSDTVAAGESWKVAVAERPSEGRGRICEVDEAEFMMVAGLTKTVVEGVVGRGRGGVI